MMAPYFPHAHGFADVAWKDGTSVVWSCLMPARILVLLRGLPTVVAEAAKGCT